MFSPRYKRTTNIDAFMARRVTFFERPINGIVYDQLRASVSLTIHGAPASLASLLAVRPAAFVHWTNGPSSPKENRPDAATTLARLAISGGRSKAHPCANGRRAETAAMLSTARGGASVARSDFVVSGDSGRKTVEPRSEFHPTRDDVGCDRGAGCTERQESRKTVARSGLLVSDGSSGNGRARLQSKLHPTRSGFLISGSHASGTVQVFVAWLEIHLSVGWAEPAKPNNQRVTATHQTSRNNN